MILGLDDFDTSKIELSYTEKKLIREQIEHKLVLEKKRQQMQSSDDVSQQLVDMQEKFIALQKENTALLDSLANLKLQELDLLKQVAEEMVGANQKNLVKGILEEAKIVQRQASQMNHLIKESEVSRTRHSKAAYAEMSEIIDKLLEEKQSDANKTSNK